MAKERDNLAAGFDTDNSGGWLTDFLAEEDDLDRRSLWRLGSWGVGSVAAVVVAVMASQSSIGARRDQIAATDLARQSQQIQSVAKESQTEARRLASAIDTLNGDRDRLYSRVTVLEQGLDNVTGSIARQNSAAGSPQAGPSLLSALEQPAFLTPPPAAAAPATTVAALTEKPRDAAPRQPGSMPATSDAANATTSAETKAAKAPAATPATPLMPSRSMMAPPDPAAAKLIEPEQPLEIITAAPVPEVVASAPAAPEPALSKASAEIAVQRTEFGVDLGGANSIDGLRVLWRTLLKSNAAAISSLRPIIVVKERNNGLGMQLRLVAGPLSDAAAAAKICAALMESARSCETSVFDGQRLAIKSDDPAPSARPSRKRSAAKRVSSEEPPPKPKSSALSSMFGTR
jgi:TolA-binding protein